MEVEPDPFDFFSEAPPEPLSEDVADPFSSAFGTSSDLAFAALPAEAGSGTTTVERTMRA